MYFTKLITIDQISSFGLSDLSNKKYFMLVYLGTKGYAFSELNINKLEMYLEILDDFLCFIYKDDSLLEKIPSKYIQTIFDCFYEVNKEHPFIGIVYLKHLDQKEVLKTSIYKVDFTQKKFNNDLLQAIVSTIDKARRQTKSKDIKWYVSKMSLSDFLKIIAMLIGLKDL